MIYGDELKSIYDALVASSNESLATMLSAKALRTPVDRQFIEALPQLDENEFAVDEQPVVSISQNGAYVMVWHWVSNETAGLVGPE